MKKKFTPPVVNSSSFPPVTQTIVQVLEPMTRNQALFHILILCQAYKSILHWQVTARVALGSLYLDNRITSEIREFISKEIETQRLYDHDHLLIPIVQSK